MYKEVTTVWSNGNDYIEMTNPEIVKLLHMTDIDGDIVYDGESNLVYDSPVLNSINDREKYMLHNGKLWKRIRKNAPMF